MTGQLHLPFYWIPWAYSTYLHHILMYQIQLISMILDLISYVSHFFRIQYHVVTIYSFCWYYMNIKYLSFFFFPEKKKSYLCSMVTIRVIMSPIPGTISPCQRTQHNCHSEITVLNALWSFFAVFPLTFISFGVVIYTITAAV